MIYYYFSPLIFIYFAWWIAILRIALRGWNEKPIDITRQKNVQNKRIHRHGDILLNQHREQINQSKKESTAAAAAAAAAAAPGAPGAPRAPAPGATPRRRRRRRIKWSGWRQQMDRRVPQFVASRQLHPSVPFWKDQSKISTAKWDVCFSNFTVESLSPPSSHPPTTRSNSSSLPSVYIVAFIPSINGLYKFTAYYYLTFPFSLYPFHPPHPYPWLRNMCTAP